MDCYSIPEEIGEDIYCQGNREGCSEIDILIENMGRVNYGHKFLADTQHTKEFGQVSARSTFLTELETISTATG